MTKDGDDPAGLVSELLAKIREYLPTKGVSLVEEAYASAARCPAGQLRLSGDPVIVHPLHAALTIADLQQDAGAVAAALLHDVQEDCGVYNISLSKRFGAEVAKLVEGVTKLGQIPWAASDERRGEHDIQAENLRKMLLAMAEDVRVVIVKLADRLHNMRTLWPLPPDDQRRISLEPREIYAPLPGRLGIWQLKWQLEDLAFR